MKIYSVELGYEWGSLCQAIVAAKSEKDAIDLVDKEARETFSKIEYCDLYETRVEEIQIGSEGKVLDIGLF